VHQLLDFRTCLIRRIVVIMNSYLIRAAVSYENIRKNFTQQIVDSSSVVGRINTFDGPWAVTVKKYLMRFMFYMGITKQKIMATALPKLY